MIILPTQDWAFALPWDEKSVVQIIIYQLQESKGIHLYIIYGLTCISTYLYKCRRGVIGEPSLMRSKWYGVGFPLTLSTRFRGGSRVEDEVELDDEDTVFVELDRAEVDEWRSGMELIDSRRRLPSFSSSRDGFRLFRSKRRK